MTRRALIRPVGAGVIGATPSRATVGLDSFAKRIFARINELRSASGVPELAWSAPLARCATDQSLRKEQLRFPGHDDPERGAVSERLEAAGIVWRNCGENIFSERGYADPVHFAVVFWWYSPGHKQNLLNPEYTETGVGVAQGSDGTFFVTQIFLLPPQVTSRKR